MRWRSGRPAAGIPAATYNRLPLAIRQRRESRSVHPARSAPATSTVSRRIPARSASPPKASCAPTGSPSPPMRPGSTSSIPATSTSGFSTWPATAPCPAGRSLPPAMREASTASGSMTPAGSGPRPTMACTASTPTAPCSASSVFPRWSPTSPSAAPSATTCSSPPPVRCTACASTPPAPATRPAAAPGEARGALPVRAIRVTGPALGGAGAEQGAFAFVAGERGGAGELGARLAEPAEPGQQVAPDRGELGVAGQDRLAGRPGAGPDPGRLQLHQRDEPVYLDLPWHEAREETAEPQRLRAQLGADPVLPRGRRVALVEDQVDDLEDRAQPPGELAGRGDLERDLRLGQGPFRPDDPLRDRRLAGQERPGDLVRGQAADQAERERRPCLGGQDRVAGDEDEAEQVIADVVVHLVDVRLAGRLGLRFHVTAYLPQLLVVAGAAPDQVDGAMLRGRHQPGAGPVRDTLDGPLLQRDHQGVLREFLRRADVAGDAGQAGDEAGRFDSPDRLDRRARGLVAIHRWRAPSPAGCRSAPPSRAICPGAV